MLNFPGNPQQPRYSNMRNHPAAWGQNSQRSAAFGGSQQVLNHQTLVEQQQEKEMRLLLMKRKQQQQQGVADEHWRKRALVAEAQLQARNHQPPYVPAPSIPGPFAAAVPSIQTPFVPPTPGMQRMPSHIGARVPSQRQPTRSAGLSTRSLGGADRSVFEARPANQDMQRRFDQRPFVDVPKIPQVQPSMQQSRLGIQFHNKNWNQIPNQSQQQIAGKGIQTGANLYQMSNYSESLRQKFPAGIQRQSTEVYRALKSPQVNVEKGHSGDANTKAGDSSHVAVKASHSRNAEVVNTFSTKLSANKPELPAAMTPAEEPKGKWKKTRRGKRKSKAKAAQWDAELEAEPTVSVGKQPTSDVNKDNPSQEAEPTVSVEKQPTSDVNKDNPSQEAEPTVSVGKQPTSDFNEDIPSQESEPTVFVGEQPTNNDNQDQPQTNEGPAPADPKEKPQVLDGTRIFVSNLPRNCSYKHLKRHFSQAGDLIFASIKKDLDGKSKGCGVLKFKEKEMAERAIFMLHNKKYRGRRLIVREDLDSEARKVRPLEPKVYLKKRKKEDVQLPLPNIHPSHYTEMLIFIFKDEGYSLKNLALQFDMYPREDISAFLSQRLKMAGAKMIKKCSAPKRKRFGKKGRGDWASFHKIAGKAMMKAFEDAACYESKFAETEEPPKKRPRKALTNAQGKIPQALVKMLRKRGIVVPYNCSKCQGRGHFEVECDKETRCRNCGLIGHLKNDCTGPQLNAEEIRQNAEKDYDPEMKTLATNLIQLWEKNGGNLQQDNITGKSNYLAHSYRKAFPEEGEKESLFERKMAQKHAVYPDGFLVTHFDHLFEKDKYSNLLWLKHPFIYTAEKDPELIILRNKLLKIFRQYDEGFKMSLPRLFFEYENLFRNCGLMRKKLVDGGQVVYVPLNWINLREPMQNRMKYLIQYYFRNLFRVFKAKDNNFIVSLVDRDLKPDDDNKCPLCDELKKVKQDAAEKKGDLQTWIPAEMPLDVKMKWLPKSECDAMFCINRGGTLEEAKAAFAQARKGRYGVDENGNPNWLPDPDDEHQEIGGDLDLQYSDQEMQQNTENNAGKGSSVSDEDLDSQNNEEDAEEKTENNAGKGSSVSDEDLDSQNDEEDAEEKTGWNDESNMLDSLG